MTFSIALCAALVALTPSWSAAADTPEPLPEGIWEVAATHTAPFEPHAIEPLMGVLVISDLRSAVAALRPDSGLVVWKRKVGSKEGIVGVWALSSAQGGVVLAAGDTLQAIRADVGTKLWERDLACSRAGCERRVVYAGPRDGARGPSLYLAAGGIVQNELVRLDPLTGAPLWHKAAEVMHPRRLLVSDDLVVSEDSQAPFAVRFLDPADGHQIGAWQPHLGDQPAPVSELFLLGDGRLVAVHLRPPEGRLAQVTVIAKTGEELTERQVPRAPQVKNQAVMASLVEDGLSIFTPDPASGTGFVTTMQLANPYTARTEEVRSWGEPLNVVGRWAFAPSERRPGATWSATGTGRWTRAVTGIDPNPLRTRTFVAGGRLALLDVGDAPGKTKTSGLATLDAKTGSLHGLGAPELGAGDIERVIPVGDEMILVRGKSLFRLVLVPWQQVIERLRAARGEGADVQLWLQRLQRFGAPAKALSDAARGVGPSRPEAPPEGPDGRLTPGSTPPGPNTSARTTARLSNEDQAFLASLREAGTGGDASETLAALLAAVGQAPERSERRLALLEASAGLVQELVLGPGVTPRAEGAESLVALARAFEWEAQARATSRSAAVIYATAMALVDESLAGADVLARVETDPIAWEARLELAGRALFQLRKSAGPLRSEMSRQMLVSSLKLFTHLDALTGSDGKAMGELLERVAQQDPDAPRKLEAALIRAEGPRASRKGAGPALCQLACVAALEACGGGDASVPSVVECQDRCLKTGAVRFAPEVRPGAKGFCR